MFPWARLLLTLLVLLGNPWGSPLLARSLVHESFHADIRVYPSGEIEVTETIRTRFEGSWNGLYRFIPVEYRTPQGFSYKLRLELESIADGRGNPLRYESQSERHYRKFKIWIPGAQDATHTVLIRYRVRNGLRFFDEHDELYWNVTGDEGSVPIETASARVQLPTDVSSLRGVAFTGPFGSSEQATEVQIRGQTVTVQALRALNIREGLTLAVIWDPGKIHRPGSLEKVSTFLSDNWIFALPILAFMIMFWLWHTRGRDPQRRPIAPRYEPPNAMTPAEVGTLMDNNADLRDLTATLVDLAVRGYLVIEEKESDQWFGLWSKNEFTFVLQKEKSEWGELLPHERELLGALFSDGSLQSVKLSDLQNKFYKNLPAIRDKIYERLVKQRFYSSRPDQVKRRYLVAAAVLFGIFFFLTNVIPAHQLLGQTSFGLLFAGGLTSLSVAFFGWFMPARTLLGARRLERVLGFEEFLRRVESDRFKRMIKGPEMFKRMIKGPEIEKYLPFAMALSVEQKWAEAFADM